MSFHDFIKPGEGWESVSHEQKFGNPYLQVFSSRVRTPSRPEGCEWTVVHRKGATVVAPLTSRGEFIMIRQERVPVRAALWEFPAGQIDETSEHDDDTIRRSALRELREETGWELAPGGELIPLGHFFSSPGFTDEHSHLFLARPVVASPRGSSPDEAEAIIECRCFSHAEFRGMIASNEIQDANTLATYARLVSRLRITDDQGLQWL